MTKINKDYIRNIIFGAEDSLVSTVGVLFGVASSDLTASQILLTGIIVVAVEASSMGVGAFLSETEVEEVSKSKKASSNPIVSGIVMLFSYILTGIIPLYPYALFEPDTAKYISIVSTVIALFLLGYIPTKRIKSAFRMAVIAGLAILVGFATASLGSKF